MFALSLILCAALTLLTEKETPEQSTPKTDEIVSEEASQIVVPVQPEIEKSELLSLSPSEKDTSSSITITNAIEPDMLAYKHWTGTYSPELFTVYINDTVVAMGETYTLTSTDAPICVQFDYSFMNGIRKGSKKISYQINKECPQAHLTFSWLDTYKIMIDNATVIKEETV